MASTRDFGSGSDAKLHQSAEDMFLRHTQWLRQLLGHRLRAQPADIDDIVQDTYLRVARQPADGIDHPKAFLARTALNLFRDAHRRDAVRARHRQAASETPPPAADPGGLSEQEARVELTRLIADMPEPYRDVFALSRFGHMTNADIATRLGLSVKTVEWRMGKALAFCMSRLRD